MQKTSNPQTLVLALGNPLSGDDAFGSQVLEVLGRNESGPPAGTALLDAHTDLLNHIETFAGYDRVVLIDAVLDPEGKLGQSGQIAVFPEEDFLNWSGTSQSVHQMSPLLSIRLFRQLYPEAQTRIWLVGLLVDQIQLAPRYSSQETIHKAANIIRGLTTIKL